MATTTYLYEKETEYFGFYPVQFVDRVINAANEQIYESADRFLTVLQASEESSLISPFQMEEGLLKLLTLMESAVDKNFDLFEMYLLKNIFRFPPSLVSHEVPSSYRYL
jgi:Mis12 protein